ncbi:MAG: hypothetical protein ACKO5K_05825 [Armatimonadota bacterium]
MESEKAEFLVCPPHHLAPVDGASAWDDGRTSPDISGAYFEWGSFLQRLTREAGRRVAQVDAVRGAPLMAMASRAGLIRNGIAVPSSHRETWRDREAPVFRDTFMSAGFIVENLPEGVVFAGAADACFDESGTLWVAYGPDTAQDAHWALADIFGCEMRSLTMASRRFGNLERAFLPLPGGRLLWYPQGFSPQSAESIRTLIPESRRYAVGEAEANLLACASLVAGRHILMPFAMDPTMQWLRDNGFQPEIVPIGHWRFFGAGASSLVLRLD